MSRQHIPTSFSVILKICMNIFFSMCSVIVNLGCHLDTPGKKETQMKDGFTVVAHCHVWEAFSELLVDKEWPTTLYGAILRHVSQGCIRKLHEQVRENGLLRSCIYCFCFCFCLSFFSAFPKLQSLLESVGQINSFILQVARVYYFWPECITTNRI